MFQRSILFNCHQGVVCRGFDQPFCTVRPCVRTLWIALACLYLHTRHPTFFGTNHTIDCHPIPTTQWLHVHQTMTRVRKYKQYVKYINDTNLKRNTYSVMNAEILEHGMQCLWWITRASRFIRDTTGMNGKVEPAIWHKCVSFMSAQHLRINLSLQCDWVYLQHM